MRSLEIDNALPEAHTALAVIVQNCDWDWKKAENEYRRAIELNPSYATGALLVCRTSPIDGGNSMKHSVRAIAPAGSILYLLELLKPVQSGDLTPLRANRQTWGTLAKCGSAEVLSYCQ